MISILIPVFNVNVCSLVQELSNQLNALNVGGEILVYDDGSEAGIKTQNQRVPSFSKIVYKELGVNHGRTKIRQVLAMDARHDWLLFIDSDSSIINNNYLSNYILAIGGSSDVYSGGRIYAAREPADCSKRLHWKYGSERESIKGSKTVLHSNNFCIRKSVFRELDFPAELSGYGHEDTWMELALISPQKKISFIDNPVLHEGLEDAKVFLEKTKSALKNLLLLPKFFDENLVRKKVRIYDFYCLQKKMGLTAMIAAVLNKRIEAINQNLVSCQPSLLNFDLYRLYHLIRISKKLY
jgi:glycosyltransferase involved in cell wall biosynthesis